MYTHVFTYFSPIGEAMKSQAIRQVLQNSPSLTTSEVRALLNDKGIEVTDNLIKVIRHRMKKAKAEADRKTENEMRRFQRLSPIPQPQKKVRKTTGWIDCVHSQHTHRLSAAETDLLNLLRELYRNGSEADLHQMPYDAEQSIPEVREWLNEVKSFRAQRRRHRILMHFSYVLRQERWPTPEHHIFCVKSWGVRPYDKVDKS